MVGFKTLKKLTKSVKSLSNFCLVVWYQLKLKGNFLLGLDWTQWRKL